MKLFQGLKKQRVFEMDIQHALMLIILGAVYADHWESESEMMLVSQIMAKSPVYKLNTEFEDARVLDACKRQLSNHPKTFDEACRFLPEPMRETAFAMCCEIVFADGIVAPTEEAFMEDLVKKLSINSDLARSMTVTFAALYREIQ